MKQENAWYDLIIGNDIATDKEVSLATDVSGYSESTFLAVAYVRTGHGSHEQSLNDGYSANEKLSEYYDI